MFKWSDVIAQNEHVKDLQRETDLERQTQLLPTPAKADAQVSATLVHWLGHQLVNWGCHLHRHAQLALHHS